MSLQYCQRCDTGIDTDFDAEHFEFPCTHCGEETACATVEECDDCMNVWLQDK